MNRFYLPLTLALFLVAGCSSSKKTATDDTPPYYLGAFEDFDDEQFEDVMPPLDAGTSEHDIPDRLTKTTSVGSSLARGFRVQLFSSLRRTDANAAMQKAITWWESRSDHRSARPPVYMEYEQPYYKVRAGNFKMRRSASEMAGQLGRTFAGAFVVPSLIESAQ